MVESELDRCDSEPPKLGILKGYGSIGSGAGDSDDTDKAHVAHVATVKDPHLTGGYSSIPFPSIPMVSPSGCLDEFQP